MARVTALYRYPVKGLTPERAESLEILAQGRVAGDRVLGFRFADAGLPASAWSKKYGFAVLVNTPGLARLDVRFDPKRLRLRIGLDGETLADDTLDDDGRKRIAAAVQRYVLALDPNPLDAHPERMPLELIGDGMTPRYADSERGEITLHARESVASLAAAMDDPALDEVRFRTNIAIEGAGAWSELGWVGGRLRIGGLDFDVVRSKVRCLATHANPATGVRDLEVMPALMRSFGQAQPTFAVALLPTAGGGTVQVGDRVEIR
jgi:uncharacterized protein YcbX